MTLGCVGLTLLLFFNIYFIFKLIKTDNFLKENNVSSNNYNFENLIVKIVFTFKLLKRQKFSVFHKILKSKERNDFFSILFPLFFNTIKNLKFLYYNILNNLYFCTVIVLVIFHGFSTFSNSFIVEVREYNFFDLFLFCSDLSCPVHFRFLLLYNILYYSTLLCHLSFFFILYCTVLYCTVLYCTVLYCTALYCTVLYCIVLHCSILYCTALFSSVLHCSVLHCSVLFCSVLYCTVLFCSYMFCSVLFCSVLFCSDRKSTRLNSSHSIASRMPSSA